MNVKMRSVLILKLDSIAVALGSILYGVQILLHPTIMETYKIYVLIRELFNNQVLGAFFILLGTLKIIGIAINNKLMKQIAIRGLLFLWLLFFIAFIITPPPNTVWVYAFLMVFLSVGASVKEG